ncbi:MAG: hypothetical protein QNL87_11345 [Gammaproteobacteria bacterium]|nr:hypothetical protein [Gammaproteobacteria bacterium]
MLNFLSSLFAPDTGKPGGLDKALIERATERAVEGTDPRLRALGNYRKQLREPVELAVRHVIELIDGLPEAVPLSRQGYSSDPRLRAFFASNNHLQEILGGFRTLSDYLQGLPGLPPHEIFGLLTLEWKERNILGMESQGDRVRRDMPQVIVNFFNHRFACPADNEDETRLEMKKRAFDYLLKLALEKIQAGRGKRQELQREQRLLDKKLDAMRAGDWGLEAMFSAGEEPVPDLDGLAAKIDAVESELLELGDASGGLERSLEQLAEVLAQPEHWLYRDAVNLRLNHMGVKMDDSLNGPVNDLQLIGLFSSSGERRIALPVRLLRSELPERPDFFKQASRYLG